MIHLTDLKTKTCRRPENKQSKGTKITPKIHKENDPGRPVINSINGHTSEISWFVNN